MSGECLQGGEAGHRLMQMSWENVEGRLEATMTRDRVSTRYERRFIVVGYRDIQEEIAEGQTLSIGRDARCDVCIGGESDGPEDLGISRRAISVTYAQGRVWVTNDSSTQPVRIRRSVGSEHVLSHRGDVVSMVDKSLELLLEGQVYSYSITVESHGPPSPLAAEEVESTAPPTQSLLPLDQRERRLVAALCEPLLTPSGVEVRPATYKEIGYRLGVQPHTVRNELDVLRARLGNLGFPGMAGTHAKDSLALYAVRSSSITVDDIGALDGKKMLHGG
jgi:hypothetical protein